jgi:DNA (cytosine-5)-methyltransferase 1
MSSYTYKTIDLFAGIGGLRLGFEKTARCKNVFSSEIDTNACLTYINNFGEDPQSDVTKLTKAQLANIPDFDILLAGFPCQTFSIAGIKKGFEDSRGQLFFDIAKILKIKKPQAFLLENVKGLVSHERGNTLKTILKILTEELNYRVTYQVLNSKDFGVPQNRERIYIVGFKRKSDFAFPTPLGIKVIIADILESGVAEKYFISERYWQCLQQHKARHQNKGNGFGYKIIEENGISNAIVVGGMGKERNLIIDRNVKTLDPRYNGAFVRKMTPREWARLQGYPDDFKIHPIDTHAYKQLGNSVTVPVITAIAENMLKALDNYNIKADKSGNYLKLAVPT